MIEVQDFQFSLGNTVTYWKRNPSPEYSLKSPRTTLFISVFVRIVGLVSYCCFCFLLTFVSLQYSLFSFEIWTCLYNSTNYNSSLSGRLCPTWVQSWLSLIRKNPNLFSFPHMQLTFLPTITHGKEPPTNSTQKNTALTLNGMWKSLFWNHFKWHGPGTQI